MQAEPAKHNRKAIATLYLCFIVATMLLSSGGAETLDGRFDPWGGRADQAGAQSGGCSSPVMVRAPSADFASIVSSQQAGTCFVLAAGTYRFHDVVPKDNMVFMGVSTGSVIIDGNGWENAFHGTADGVTIAAMTFAGFNDSGGTSRQEQAPIRGTSALWASDRGQLATNWLITDIASHGNYASGLFLGDHWTVRNSIFHSNGVTGIGGDSIVGGVIEANIVYGNGEQQAGGAAVNGGGVKITQAGTPASPVIVRNNEFYDNSDIAVWCDIGCDGFHVLDNYIHDHRSRGIMYELSSNLVASGNTILRSNTWTDFRGDFNAGAITMGESRGGVIENNFIDEARAGVTIRQTKRPASGEGFLSDYPYVNYITSDVVVRNNIIRNAGAMGISTGASGGGQITKPNSVVFSGNTYDDPAVMTFWWNNGEQLAFGEWQNEGRDSSSNGSQPSSPVTQRRGPSATPSPVPTLDPGPNPQPAPTSSPTSAAPPTTPAPPVGIAAPPRPSPSPSTDPVTTMPTAALPATLPPGFAPTVPTSTVPLEPSGGEKAVPDAPTARPSDFDPSALPWPSLSPSLDPGSRPADGLVHRSRPTDPSWRVLASVSGMSNTAVTGVDGLDGLVAAEPKPAVALRNALRIVAQSEADSGQRFGGLGEISLVGNEGPDSTFGLLVVLSLALSAAALAARALEPQAMPVPTGFGGR